MSVSYTHLDVYKRQMNAFTYGGFRCGVFTLCGDLLKGFFPVFLYRSGELPENPLMLSFVMAAPVLGHILPFYDIKHGGKGIAATFGCFLGLLPHWIPLCVLAGIFIFFSCVVKINPNYYRTVATVSYTHLDVYKRQTDDKTVRFRKFRRNFVDKIVKNAVPQLRTLPACHTSSDVFIADMNNFRFNAFFVENIHHFMQSNGSIAVRLRAAV